MPLTKDDVVALRTEYALDKQWAARMRWGLFDGTRASFLEGLRKYPLDGDYSLDGGEEVSTETEQQELN